MQVFKEDYFAEILLNDVFRFRFHRPLFQNGETSTGKTLVEKKLEKLRLKIAGKSSVRKTGKKTLDDKDLEKHRLKKT